MAITSIWIRSTSGANAIIMFGIICSIESCKVASETRSPVFVAAGRFPDHWSAGSSGRIPYSIMTFGLRSWGRQEGFNLADDSKAWRGHMEKSSDERS